MSKEYRLRVNRMCLAESESLMASENRDLELVCREAESCGAALLQEARSYLDFLERLIQVKPQPTSVVLSLNYTTPTGEEHFIIEIDPIIQGE